MRRLRIIALLLLASAAAARAQGPSLAIGINVPVGGFADVAGSGFSVALRDEGELGWVTQRWAQMAYRLDVDFTHFAKRGSTPSMEYQSVSFNLVHRPSLTLYEFAGPGIYNSTASRSDRYSRRGTNFGVQGGVGYVWESKYQPFVEFGATNLFTSGSNTPWFVIRTGGHY